MPQEYQTYRVFISSPGGLSRERKIAQEVIRAISSNYERRGVAISSWVWETDSVSEFGNQPQSIITQQLGKYDIYLGIMAGRFGSATARYGSGTEEEFFDALELFQQKGYPKLGFFFKSETLTTTRLSADSIDQLRRVQEFKDKIGPLGLYQEFAEDHQLGILITNLVAGVIERDIPQSNVINLQYTMQADTIVKQPMVSRYFFNDILNAVDSNISNGGELITLADIWIDPALSVFLEEDAVKQTLLTNFEFSDLVSDLISSQKLLILGAEASGKTSVCRRLFMDLFSAGYLPILIQGEKINNPDIARFEQRVRVAYSDQYEHLTVKLDENFLRSKCIIIVDDYDLAKLNSKTSNRLLKSICNHFFAVALTASPTYEFGFLENMDEAEILGALKRVRISDLGNSKRYNLVERWCSFGKSAIDEENLRPLIENKRKIINRMLSSNLIPRTPFMILILLRAMEVGQAGDLVKTGYVRYYKFLIDSAILKNVSAEDAEGAYALLPEFAWKMYELGVKELSPEDAEKTIEEFSIKRALRKPYLYNVLGNLRRIGMFDKNCVNHKFKYDYAYYFFLADYMSRNLQSSSMQECVRTLCSKVSNKESATILNFLAFHSDNEIIVETLIAGLTSVYTSSKQFEFSTARTASINRLVFDLPTLVVDHTKHSENRDLRLRAEDLEENGGQQGVPSDSEIGPISTMRGVFTAVEILGHILRNHYARLDAEPKRLIFEATTRAILRCVDDMFEHLSSSVDALVIAIRTLTDKVDNLSSDKAKERAAKNVVFFISVAFLCYCSRQLARSIGDEKLEMTYGQALGSSPSLTAKYVDSIIKLDAFREFPLRELREVVSELRDNHVGMTALRLAVAERLDMRPPTQQGDLQKFCDAVGLGLKSRLIAQRRR